MSVFDRTPGNVGQKTPIPTILRITDIIQIGDSGSDLLCCLCGMLNTPLDVPRRSSLGDRNFG